MATVEKIRNDIAKTKDKIAELQKKQRALEAQLAEEENLEIYAHRYRRRGVGIWL